MENDAPVTAETWPALPPLPEGEWPEQGKWTYEDYLRLPEVPRRRFEVLFGVLWTTRAPTVSHETAVHRVAYELERHIEQDPGGLLLAAPAEVVLPGLAEPVKPDLLYLRPEHAGLVSGGVVQGPPDLVVEVLARRTGRLDKRVKLPAYERGGVRECWIVDPRGHTIAVHTLEGEAYALLGEYAPGDTLTSRVLPSLQLPAARIFGR